MSNTADKLIKREPCKPTVYSRVVGFLAPVSNWNKGKQEEFKDRKEYILR